MKQPNLKRPNPDSVMEVISNGSRPRFPSRPARVSSRSRGSTGPSITEVTDQVSPDSDRDIKSKFIKSLNELENLKDELFPSPKSTTHTNAQRKRLKRNVAFNSVNKGEEVDEEKSSKKMKVSRGIKKSANDEGCQSMGPSRFMKDRETGEFKSEHDFEEFKAITEEIPTITVDLDISVSSVEVSEDEQEEKGITRCDWCKKKFQEKDWGKLRRHKKLPHGTPCPSCNLMFVDEDDLIKHSSQYHSKRKNYVYECRKCLKKNQSLKSNLKHEELNHPYQCRLCVIQKVIFPLSFTSERGLQVHKEQKHKIRKTVEIDLAKGDESKDSVESIEVVVVKPKIIKQRKDESDSTRKSSIKSNVKSGKAKEKGDEKKNPEPEFVKSEIPKSDKKVDQLPADFSNFIKNESLTEETNNECKLDYSRFIINECLEEDQMSKKVVIANDPVEEEFMLDSKPFKKENQVSKVERRKKFENQNMCNDVKSSEEPNGKEEELSVNNVETGEKELPVDREANEKESDLKGDNIILKNENNIQDSEISTTCRNTPQKINEEYFVDGIDMGVDSEAEENYNTDNLEEEIENNEDISKNQDNEKRKQETPLKSSQCTPRSYKTPEQGEPLEDVCRSNQEKETLDLPLVKNGHSNSEIILPKFVKNSNKKQFAVFSKVNGKLQVTPAKLKKSDQEHYKTQSKMSDTISSEQITLFDSNDRPVEINRTVNGVSELLPKRTQSCPNEDIKQNSESCLLVKDDHPRTSVGQKENISLDKRESSAQKKNISLDKTVSNGPKEKFSLNIKASSGPLENFSIEKTGSRDPEENFSHNITVSSGHEEMINQATQSNSEGVNRFSKKTFKERPTVSDGKLISQETLPNKTEEKPSYCDNTENLDTEPSNKDNLVMKIKSTENMSCSIVVNVTPHISTMPKAFDGLSLISTTYFNISSDTDSPLVPHLPEVLDSESPIGQPIGSSSPLQGKPKSVPLEIGKIDGIQAFKDQRKSREVWKVGKRKTNSVPRPDVTRKSVERKSIDTDSERIETTRYIASPLVKEPIQDQVKQHPNEITHKLFSNDLDTNQAQDLVDELGLDVTDIEHFDDVNSVNFDMKERFERCGKKSQDYAAPVIESEKEKPLIQLENLESDESLANIEDLLGSDDDDDDVPAKPDVRDDEHSPERHLIHEASENAEDRLKDQMKNKRFSDSLSCDYCDRIFDRVSLLKNHMLFAHNVSSNDSFVCDFCQHHFKRRRDLKGHIFISHNYKCQHCSLTFHLRSQMESHSTDAHPDGRPDQSDLEETDSLQAKLLECEFCEESFHWEEFLQHTELSHTVPCKHQLDPESNNAPHLWFVSENALAWHVHREHDGPEPDCEEKPREARLDQLDISNPVNIQIKKKFNPKIKEPKEENKNIHESDFDQYTRFSDDRQFESVTCCICGLEFEEVDQFRKHSGILHPFACSHGECQKRFTNQKNLSDHLTKDHSVSFLNNGEDTIKLTATRSIANIEMINTVEEWMRSPDVVEHLVRVMKGELKSRRHKLFMDRKEREQSGVIKTSKLYVLSNPAFMGDVTGERDSDIINYLIEDVFNIHLHESDIRLREIGLNSGFIYATTVLFPEMFLNQHQVRNKLSREEAERAFMEIEVTDEEREGLEQEIRGGVVSQEEEDISEHEWIDVSVADDNEFENTIVVEDSD